MSNNFYQQYLVLLTMAPRNTTNTTAAATANNATTATTMTTITTTANPTASISITSTTTATSTPPSAAAMLLVQPDATVRLKSVGYFPTRTNLRRSEDTLSLPGSLSSHDLLLCGFSLSLQRGANLLNYFGLEISRHAEGGGRGRENKWKSGGRGKNISE